MLALYVEILTQIQKTITLVMYAFLPQRINWPEQNSAKLSRNMFDGTDSE